VERSGTKRLERKAGRVYL